MISDLVVGRSGMHLFSCYDFNIELFISDKVLAMILSMLSKADALNAMVKPPRLFISVTFQACL